MSKQYAVILDAILVGHIVAHTVMHYLTLGASVGTSACTCTAFMIGREETRK